MVQMVAYLSGEEHGDVIDQAQVLVDRLSHLAERDTEAFQAVMVAYKLPKQGEEGKRFRRVAIQSGLKMATEVPLQVMNVATDVLVLAKKWRCTVTPTLSAMREWRGSWLQLPAGVRRITS